jgi:hypothetical protein
VASGQSDDLLASTDEVGIMNDEQCIRPLLDEDGEGGINLLLAGRTLDVNFPPDGARRPPVGC